MKLGELRLDAARGLWNRIPLLAATMGPGIITALVNTDAGGITTYTLAGAHYGNLFLWATIPITVLLIAVQEMTARMGVVTGKGLADLIRENYGVKVTFYLMLGLIGANFGNVIANFAGVAASVGLFGVPKALSVIVSGVFVWWLVTQGDYKRVEKVLLTGCLLYLAYILSAYFAKPDWGMVARDAVTPRLPLEVGAVAMLIGLIGCDVAPWMPFFQQSSVVDKGLQARDYRSARLDVIAGCVATEVVTFCIIVACSATLFKSEVRVEDAAQAAEALRPLAGKWSAHLFAFGLFNASLLAASVLPLSTAYSVCEGLGWQTGLDRRFEEAPQFYGLYTLLIAFGALVVCWPGFPLIKVMYWSQVINGVLLPAVLVLCVELSGRKDVMGEYANPPWLMWSMRAAAAFIGLLSLVLAGMLLAR